MKHQTLNVGLITTVSGRWPRELPKSRHLAYTEWLESQFADIHLVKMDELAINNNDVEETAEFFKRNSVDLVVYLIGAFTGDYAVTYLAEALNVPIIIWAPYEPPFDGGRLMANSLVAATMNAAAMHRLGGKFHFVYGDIADERVVKEVSQYIHVYAAIKKLRKTFLGLLGYRPTAFYSSTFDETLIRKVFGLKMEEYDLKTVFDKMVEMDADKVKTDMESLSCQVDVTALPEGHLENHSRLYLTLVDFIKEQGFDAISLKCWPEMGNLKTTPCAAMSRLADEKFVIGCESDIDATLTMLAQQYLTDDYVFMSDLIDINEENNTALFWHCGQAARKLKDPASDIQMRNHPLAGQGAVFETTLKPGQITVARFCNIRGAYKLFLARGEAIPTQKVTKGVMVNVVMEKPVRDMLYKIAEEGVPHHYSMVWDDVAEKMRLMSKLLGIEVIEA